MAWSGKNNEGPWGKKPSSSGQNVPPNVEDFDMFLRRGKKKIGGFLPGDGFSKSFFLLLVLVLTALWGLTGFFVVDANEEGVVLRFGRYHRTVGSGLNYHMPYPLEKAIVLNVMTIRREEIGLRSGSSHRQPGTRNVDAESLMLTGDENIVDINFEVQWRIKESKDYLFNIRNLAGENTVKSAAESAMRQEIGQSKIASALTEGRELIEQNTKVALQRILDSYGSGIEIVELKMLKVDPPKRVIDSFRDVQTAKADKEREINKAEAYRNDILPRARGQAERIRQEAQAYEQQVVARATGEADRFLAVYNQYKHAKPVTKRRMYIETMERVLEGADKIIIDQKVGGSGVLPYLPLSELRKSNGGK